MYNFLSTEKPTSPMPIRHKFNSIASDEEPLYDVVASDEDYSSIDNLSINSSKTKHMVSIKKLVSTDNNKQNTW